MELKQILESKPSIKMVYFDTNGDYAFHKTEKFCIEKTREEILEVEVKTVKTKKNEKAI